MSSDPHGAAAHDDDDLDVSLSPELRLKLLIGLAVCVLCVLAVAVFILIVHENAGPPPERIQDQRDALLSVAHALFA